MSKNIKEIGKELLGKSLNGFHRKTGLTQLEKNNEMQDGILDGILSQVDDAYIEKTEQSNVIHLDGSGDGVVVLDSIEGNTVVNLIGTALDDTTYYTKNPNGSIDIIKHNTSLPPFNNDNYHNLNLLKPNTQYTLVVMGEYSKIKILLRDYFIDENGINNSVDIKNMNLTSSKTLFTTNNNRTYMKLLSAKGGSPDDYPIQNIFVMILEGDWTNKEIPTSYIEGLQSSFEEKINDEGKYKIEILSKNKSLIDWNIENLENYYDDSFNFSIEDNSIKVKSNYQKAYGFKKGFYVQEGETYTISVEGKKTDGEYSAMYLGDETLDYFKKDTFILVPANTSSNILDGSNYGTKVVTMVARKSGFVNRWIIHSSEMNNYYWIRNVFLEKGETVSCIPQKQNKIKLLLNEPLRSVHNVKDRLYIKDNKLFVERNVFEKSFDGTESIGISKLTDSTINMYYGISATLAEGSLTSHMCDRLPNVGHTQWDKPIIGTHCKKTSVFFNIPLNWLGGNTINDVKQYLTNQYNQGTPMKIVHILNEPVYEEVLNEYGEPIILEGYENGTLYIDSTVIPTITVRYTPKMESFKTLKEVNKNNNLITLDINENIIPYMMDVDYMIMEKELCLLNTKNIRKMEVLDMTSMQKRTHDMLERLIKGKTLTEQECKTRITTYVHAGKITDEQAEELMLLIDEVYA